MTVGEMQSRMSAQELDRWARYEADEGLPAFQTEAMLGMVCVVLANANRGKNTPPFELQDFMLFDRASRERQRIDRARADFPDVDGDEDLAMQRWVAALGGKARG